MDAVNFKVKKRENFKWVVLLCLIGWILNLTGAAVASELRLPMYLDTIGTLLVAAIGGYLPGIAVGFVSNYIKAYADQSAIYYECLSVIMAVVTAFYAERGWLKKIWGVISLTFLCALIGGGLGAILTWFLYGFAAEGISVGFVKSLYESGKFSLFQAQFAGDFLLDLADKTVNMIVILPIYYLLPARVKDIFQLNGWQQKPLSVHDERAAGVSDNRSASIRTKMLGLITGALLIVAIASTGIGYKLYMDDSIDNHFALAKGVAATAAGVVEPFRIDDYIDKGYAAIGYVRTENSLYALRSSSKDIEYIYVYRIVPGGCQVVFDLDTPEVQGALAGEIIPFDDSFAPYIDALLAGKEIDPIITDDTFGWLLTVYQPIYDEDGVCQAYACVDISMDQLRLNGYSFLAKQISLFIGIFILVLAVGLWVIRYNLIFPVNTMAMAATDFAYHIEDMSENSVEHIKELQISTGDEIENLYRAFSKMTEDSVTYVNELNDKDATIRRMQDSLILVLADMVESRDKNTGDHVRKTATYTRIIMNELCKEGIYTDVLTPEFMSDVVKSAPLHDIGKISVSDSILNKPGKLTDDEFDQMKSHTTAGSEIVQRVIETVPEAGYLDTAKELAEYHHEKWNGKGYPHGISGEEIPLSARIMAVADVFDALVSKRSYKDGMPPEKAFGIIEEGRGTHFDPYVAQAFLNAEDEVREVLNEYRKDE
ncbi:MAG: HD domain-containing protein [Lachnospiraceae bacterium]|nr:HD domain-containing protein [Lachnospiraceae bacterium]